MSAFKTRQTKSVVKYLDSEVNNEKLIQDITCSGCFKEYSTNRVPKILNCLHNLCSECINISIQLNSEKNKVVCPICDKSCIVDDAERFRTHSFVMILSDIASCYRSQLENTLNCIGCRNGATLRCLTCNENYCQEHTDFHVRSRATSHHKVLTFKQILGTPLLISTIQRDENCTIHSRRILEFFCFTCRLPICTACALSSHKACTYEELSIAVSALKQKFENMRPAFNRKAYKLKKDTTALSEGMKQLGGDHEMGLAGISDMSDKIMRQLRQREANVGLSIEDHRKDSQGELRVHQSFVEDKINNLESGVDFVETVFEYWSPAEVLSVENEIVKRLTELSENPEEFAAENVKPKPFELPPDTTSNVVDSISFLENGAFKKPEPKSKLEPKLISL